MKHSLIVLVLCAWLWPSGAAAFAEPFDSTQATWIWYPGDFEVWLHREVSLRRTERGGIMPTMWRLDTHYGAVQFHRNFRLTQPETVALYADGTLDVILDGQHLSTEDHRFTIPAGTHQLMVSVINYTHVPALFVKGKTLASNERWTVTCFDKAYPNAQRWNLNDPQVPPSQYKLATKEIKPIKIERPGKALLVDFGKETFGYLRLKNVSRAGKLTVYYGESREEALSKEHAETLDYVTVGADSLKQYTFPGSKAFRYVHIIGQDDLQVEDVAALYEYLPVDYRGSFRCSNEKVNQIWDVAAYTLHLNTREFFLDGIKRDRWVWSGDAYQSFLMNYYLFFDEAVSRRTLVALRGKDPVKTHINTILDYSFYWFVGIYDYYLYTGDQRFIEQIYPSMITLMDFCLNRRNANGMVEGLSNDWVFIDWAEMDKRGEVSTEQILFARSLETMALCAQLVKDGERAAKFRKLAEELKAKTLDTFWDSAQKGLVQSRFNGILNKHLTKYPNMFALTFGYLDEQKAADVKQHVLLNDRVQKITTPYMRFYELASLCEIGQHRFVVSQVLDYWGGMLDLGATSFWEEYDPTKRGIERYAMYGRPFGKSLCHAWGASPIYLFGKHFLGVKPTSAGYATYAVEPHLGGLAWIEGAVPTPRGEVKVRLDTKQIRVRTAAAGVGTLRFQSKKKPKASTGELTQVASNTYQLTLDRPGTEYVISYAAVE